MTTAFAVVFPGQGSQSLGMLNEMNAHYPEIKQTMDEASQVLAYDLWQVIQHGPEQRLNATQITQPAMLAADVALWRVIKNRYQLKPLFMAGHSLGEYSALVAQGTLSFTDAVAIVTERARLMQNAVPEQQGAMAAVIGMNDDAVKTMCEQLAADDEVLAPANYNAPGQIVVSGHHSAIERVSAKAKRFGAKMVKVLPVSIPAHSPLMCEASHQFGDFLAHFSWHEQAAGSVLHNVDADLHATSEVCQLLTQQLYQPVRWVATIERMKRQGVSAIVECGPGKVLTGLNKRIDRTLEAIALEEPNDIEALEEKL
jgi:[acyl-carrier-protein] S-malonyltransferase